MRLGDSGSLVVGFLLVLFVMSMIWIDLEKRSVWVRIYKQNATHQVCKLSNLVSGQTSIC